MSNNSVHKKELDENGFTILENIFNAVEVAAISEMIDANSNVLVDEKKLQTMFALRKVLMTIPAMKKKLFTTAFQDVINALFGRNFFIVKSLYFNKPALSNWFVPFHQDLSISVSEKIISESFKNWTVKENQFSVQPPLAVLENIYTIRVHLDDCTKDNGALHVIPGSHKNGICKVSELSSRKESAIVCDVPKGGIMLMRPLLLHASHKSIAVANRRVLHLEFSNMELPHAIQWAEKEYIS